jgi:hypothetical protein
VKSDLKYALIKYNGQKANVGRRRQIVTNSETLVLKTKSDTAKVRLGTHLVESPTSLRGLGSSCEQPRLLDPNVQTLRVGRFHIEFCILPWRQIYCSISRLKTGTRYSVETWPSYVLQVAWRQGQDIPLKHDQTSTVLQVAWRQGQDIPLKHDQSSTVLQVAWRQGQDIPSKHDQSSTVLQVAWRQGQDTPSKHDQSSTVLQVAWRQGQDIPSKHDQSSTLLYVATPKMATVFHRSKTCLHIFPTTCFIFRNMLTI